MCICPAFAVCFQKSKDAWVSFIQRCEVLNVNEVRFHGTACCQSQPLSHRPSRLPHSVACSIRRAVCEQHAKFTTHKNSQWICCTPSLIRSTYVLATRASVLMSAFASWCVPGTVVTWTASYVEQRIHALTLALLFLQRTGSGEAEAAADAKPSCFPRFDSLQAFKDYIGSTGTASAATSAATSAAVAQGAALLTAAAVGCAMLL